MAVLEPKLRIGDYELVRLLGRGGMGDVWVAKDLPAAGRQVALKFIKQHFLDDPAFRLRFLNEASAMGKLDHDRIVTLYRVLDSDGHLALVMRFIDGRSLADRIDEEGALPLKDVMACCRDILPALGSAHERGIIHRDIKPQNILVDKQSRCFLTDFGIAVGDFAERATVTGFAVGTPHYMSPEQIQRPRDLTAQAGGHRTDIYSFGIVLYEMVTGRVPFGNDSGQEDMYKIQNEHCTQPAPPIRQWNPSVPPAFEAAILRSLEKNPDDRPATCEEFLADLEAALSGQAPVPERRRSGTVVEKADQKVPGPIDNKLVPPRPVPAKGIPKNAWLAIGGVLVAAAIGYAILSSDKPIDGGGRKGDSTVISGTTDPVAVPDTPGNGTPNGDRKGEKKSETKGETKGARKGDGTTTGNGDGTTSGQPPGPAPPDPAAAQNAAEAKTLYDQGDYCGAKKKIDDAAGLDPQNRQYQILRTQYAKACNLSQ